MTLKHFSKLFISIPAALWKFFTIFTFRLISHTDNPYFIWNGFKNFFFYFSSIPFSSVWSPRCWRQKTSHSTSLLTIGNRLAFPSSNRNTTAFKPSVRFSLPIHFFSPFLSVLYGAHLFVMWWLYCKPIPSVGAYTIRWKFCEYTIYTCSSVGKATAV